MGIQGLLPQLKSIQQPVTLVRYNGQTLAIDGYAWLHRAAHSCAEELALGRPTSKYLEFFVKRLNMLQNRYNIRPYLVFDGDAITVKKDTEVKRKSKRVESREKALALWRSGDKRQAYEYFQKCVDVTPEMAKCVIEYCQVQNIDYVVAPFEADAQMVYLEKMGLVHGIISEDSDLLIFGCRRLITKLNDHGEGIEICSDDFQYLPHKFPLSQLSPEEMRIMVCLSGCDYTAGIPKVGLLTAMKLVRKHRTIDNIIKHIQREGKFAVPKDFVHEYQLATFAFQFQRVFCPQTNVITTLNVIPEDLLGCSALFESIGRVISKETHAKEVIMDITKVDHELHARIAWGELCPYNHEKDLVNRERKLQLSTKSEPILSRSTTSTVGKIDSFFGKSALVSVSAAPTGASAQVRAAIRKQEEKQNEITRKLVSTVERRKLSRHNTPVVAGVGMSRFFSKSFDGSAHEYSGNATSAPSVESSPPRQSDSDDTSKASPSGHSGETDSQEDIPTDIPSSLLSTDVPSSMVPTQVDVEASFLSEEDSEILSEVDEAATRRNDVAPTSKRHCKSLADLRESFRYKRAPLGEKSVNVLAAKTGVDTCAAKKSVEPHTKKQRPIMNRSRHYVASPSSNDVQRQAVRTLSLSEFIYRGH